MDNAKSKFKALAWPLNLVADVTGRDDFSEEEVVAMAARMVKSLPMKERKVVQARYQKQLSIEKVGIETNIQRSTASKMVSSIVDKLAETDWSQEEAPAKEPDEQKPVIEEQDTVVVFEDEAAVTESEQVKKQDEEVHTEEPSTAEETIAEDSVSAEPAAPEKKTENVSKYDSECDSYWYYLIEEFEKSENHLDKDLAEKLWENASGSMADNVFVIKTKTPVAYMFIMSSYSQSALQDVVSGIAGKNVVVSIVPDYLRQGVTPPAAEQKEQPAETEMVGDSEQGEEDFCETAEMEEAPEAAPATEPVVQEFVPYNEFKDSPLYAGWSAIVKLGKRVVRYFRETQSQL